MLVADAQYLKTPLLDIFKASESVFLNMND